MTDTEINIAIAEACGWKPQTICRDITGTPFPGFPPNYCADLNAMHEAEKTLRESKGEVGKYVSALWNAMYLSPEAGIGTIHATARQRAEAFLRTIGKWVDSPEPVTA